MARKRIQLSTWQRAMETASTHAKPLGVSPGGAAAQLGCSRQAVHGLIKRGRLDAVAVYDGDELAFYLVQQPSIDRYKAELVQAINRRFGLIA